MDQIKIKRLEVFAKHGVLTEENDIGTEIPDLSNVVL